MSNFKQNTVETVGDAALAESIIDRSIPDLQDSVAISIAAQKFRGCKSLASVIFQSVTSVGIGAFWQCTALKQADFAACVTFAQNAFYGCSALEALILRSEAVCSQTSAFSSSGIASGKGYIYVPAALVDTYKADSKWSTYASQIRAIEDYPSVCSKYSWVSVFAAIDAGTYATDYEIGDTVELDLGSEGLVNMQIVAFNTDDKADGSGKAPITWISKELLKTSQKMNPYRVTNSDGTYQDGTGSIGGWEKCEMRTYLNDTIKPLIPADVRNKIVSVTKTQLASDTAGSSYTQTTEDDVWIPSNDECNGAQSLYYELFKNTKANRVKYKVGSSSANDWWLRNGNGVSTNSFINANGEISSVNHNMTKGIALGFCT